MTNFDTYIFIKNLQDAGLSELQAKAISDGMQECHMAFEFATKADFIGLQSELKSEMAEFKVEMRSEMAEFKTEIRAEMAAFKTEIRAEMAAFKTEIRAELACLEARLDKKISDVAHRQTKMLGGMMIGAVALMTFVDRYLPPNLADLGEFLLPRLT